MNLAFVIIAILIVAGATAAMTLRNLVHCALSLTCALGGVAFLYLLLGVQFVGFAQFLVYIGAVAILIVFAILITRGIESTGEPIFAPGRWAGWASSLLVFAVLAGAVWSSKALPVGTAAVHEPTVREIGNLLMTRYILPLEIIGLLLTAALIGGVLVAMKPNQSKSAPARDAHQAAAPASKEEA
jgi:NADH-quinone oxidoreductase subunit J